MTGGWFEIVLWVVAALVITFLAVDFIRSRGAARREQERLDGLDDPGFDDDLTDDDEAPERPSRVGRRLRSAGLGVGGGVFLACCVLFGILVAFGVLEAFPRALLPAVLGGIVAGYLPWTLVRSWARHRARKFEEKLVDAVGFMIGALEAGENPTQALSTAGEASEGAVNRSFAEIVERLDLGMSIREALRPMAEGYDSEGTRLFSQTLIAKWSTGGDLAPVLRSVNRIMRDRLAMRMRMWSEMAGARASAVIVSVLPYTLIPVLLWRRPEWMESLTSHPLGLQLVFVAVVLQMIGILWLRRILRGDEL